MIVDKIVIHGSHVTAKYEFTPRKTKSQTEGKRLRILIPHSEKTNTIGL